MKNFISKIREQLKIMSEQKKEAWIISQAKLTPEPMQESIYKSLCSAKNELLDLSHKQ